MQQAPAGKLPAGACVRYDDVRPSRPHVMYQPETGE